MLTAMPRKERTVRFQQCTDPVQPFHTTYVKMTKEEVNTYNLQCDAECESSSTQSRNSEYIPVAMILEQGKIHHLQNNANSPLKQAQKSKTDPVKTEAGTEHQERVESSSRQAQEPNHRIQSQNVEQPDPIQHEPGEAQSHTSSLQPEKNCAEVSQEDRGANPCPAKDCREMSSDDHEPSSCAGDGCSGSDPSRTGISRTSAKISKMSSGNIDAALKTLKSELTAMREQDLQLLKQLIHINDNIRRLKRARWLQRGGRTVSCGFLGARSPGPTPHPPGGCYPGGVMGGREGGGGGGGLLTRQRSEPGLLGVPGRKVSTLTSTSSSFETIEDGDEEADSLYGSFSDLPSDNSPAPSPFSPCKPPTPSTPNTRSPSAYTSLTFTQEELWRGECSYGEILKRNIRLWKWSVAHERESGVAGGHFCVL